MIRFFRILIAVLVLVSSTAKASEIPIEGIAHVAFQSSSLERSRAFYTGFVGFEYSFAVSEKSEAWYLKVNDDQFVKLISKQGQTSDDRLVEIALKVSDAKETFNILKQKGLEPTKLIKRKDGTMATTVRDPDNHVIAFVEYTPKSLQSRSVGKNLGARRIAQRLWRASLTIKDESKSHEFYSTLLGFEEHWRGIWPHDQSSESVHLQLPGARGDLLEYVLVEDTPTRDQLASMHHAGYQTEDVLAVHEQTGKFGRPRLEKYMVQTDALGRPFFNLYCTDEVRVEIMQATSSPLLSAK
ncbi:VOC family protein [Vibrio sp. FNV 38]|nr:VOC family protein [Vibrio sp. FNV 38]